MNDAGYPCIWCNAFRYNICEGDERCEPYKKWREWSHREMLKWRYIRGND